MMTEDIDERKGKNVECGSKCGRRRRRIREGKEHKYDKRR